jgi:Bacterial Ig-like domain (group 2)
MSELIRHKVTPPQVVLVSIAVTPTDGSVFETGTQQMTAIGTFSNSTTMDLTSSVTWSSSLTGFVTIAPGGAATWVAEGTSVITATLGSIHGSTNLTAFRLGVLGVGPQYWGRSDLSTAPGLVSIFTDLSGHGNSATASGTARPTASASGGINNKADVIYAGGQVLATPGITLDAFTYVIIFKLSGTAGIIVERSVNADANTGEYLYGTAPGSNVTRNGVTVSPGGISGNWAEDGIPHLCVYTWEDGKGGYITLGGTAISTNIPGTLTPDAQPQPIFFGGRGSGPSFPITGSLPEIAAYNFAPTVAEWYQLLGYYAAFWAPPAIPSGGVLALNALIGSQITLGGNPATDGSLVDNWSGAVQAAMSLQPTYDFYCHACSKGVSFGGTGQSGLGVQATALVAPSVAISIPFTIAVRGHFQNPQPLASAPIFELGDTSTGLGILLDAVASTIKIVGPSGTTTATMSFGGGSTLQDNKPHRLIVTCDVGGTVSAWLDNNTAVISQAGTAPGTGSIAGNLTVGAGHAIVNTAFSTGVLSFLDFWNRVLTPDEIAGLDSYLLATSNWNPSLTGMQQSFSTIAIGNSIQYGYEDGGPTFSHTQVLVQNLGTRFGAVNNQAIPGARLTIGSSPENILGQWNAIVSGGLPVGDIIVFIEGGINDVDTLNPPDDPTAITDAVTINGYLATVVNQVASDLAAHTPGPLGHRIVLSTMTTGFITGPTDYCRQLVNANTRTVWGGATPSGITIILDDIGADPILGVFPKTPPYFTATDLIHPSTIGNYRWAGKLGQQLLALGL